MMTILQAFRMAGEAEATVPIDTPAIGVLYLVAAPPSPAHCFDVTLEVAVRAPNGEWRVAHRDREPRTIARADQDWVWLHGYARVERVEGCELRCRVRCGQAPVVVSVGWEPA